MRRAVRNRPTPTVHFLIGDVRRAGNLGRRADWRLPFAGISLDSAWTVGITQEVVVLARFGQVAVGLFGLCAASGLASAQLSETFDSVNTLQIGRAACRGRV